MFMNMKIEIKKEIKSYLFDLLLNLINYLKLVN